MNTFFYVIDLVLGAVRKYQNIFIWWYNFFASLFLLSAVLSQQRGNSHWVRLKSASDDTWSITLCSKWIMVWEKSRHLLSSMSVEREHVLVLACCQHPCWWGSGHSSDFGPFLCLCVARKQQWNGLLQSLASTEFVWQGCINKKWSSWIPQAEFPALEVKTGERTEGFAM